MLSECYAGRLWLISGDIMPIKSVILNMDKLNEIRRESNTRADRIVQKIALDCEARIGLAWNPNSPSPEGQTPGVDTGNLKNSIEVEPGDSPLSYVVHDGVPYGIHLEFGTESMGTRPWLTPAVEETAANIPPDLLQEIITG